MPHLRPRHPAGAGVGSVPDGGRRVHRACRARNHRLRRHLLAEHADALAERGVATQESEFGGDTVSHGGAETHGAPVTAMTDLPHMDVQSPPRVSVPPLLRVNPCPPSPPQPPTVLAD